MSTAAPQDTKQRLRGFTLALVDCLAWAVGLTATLVLRLDIPGIAVRWDGLQTVIPIACGVQLAAGLLAGLYQTRWRIGSFEEVTALIGAMIASALAVFGLNFALGRPVPASVPVGGGVLALALAAGIRYLWRLQRERRLRPSGQRARRLVIFGAGDAGSEVVNLLVRNPASSYVPVAFLDDDPAKRNLRIRGIPVLGGRGELERVLGQVGCDVLLIAVPSVPTTLLREVAQRAEACGAAVRVLPSLAELLGGEVRITDLRPLAEAELIGRVSLQIDQSRIAESMRSRRVLVTGAGGSIGAELCQQVSRLDPAALVMLDRDESALHSTQLMIHGHARLDTPDVVVADIRDQRRMFEVFNTTRPDVVFHAAALKHLPILELYPSEALKTNVRGTEHVLLAALDAGVDRFVNISTDKAADPVSVLGYTKRLTERLTAWAGTRSSGTYLSVRFGNVLGSRGSILTIFQAQIAAGGPVTVTHPEVTRYFMTVEEAVQLVLQSTVVGRAGEALVLDMGEPMPIRRLAERLVAAAPAPTEIVFTGLRRGEKLHEALLGAGEVDQRPFHPLLAQVPVPTLAPRALDGLDDLTEEELPRALAELCSRDEQQFPPSLTRPVSYVIVDSDGHWTAMTPAPAPGARPGADDEPPIVASAARLDALHADGTPMPAGEFPSEVTRRTGRALEDVVCNLRLADGRRAWVTASSRPVALDADHGQGVLLCFREVAWDPDPGRPEVIAAVYRFRAAAALPQS